MDRINIQTLSTIQLTRFDHKDIQVGCSDSGLTLRFGYWQKLSDSDVVKVNEILPNHLCLQLNLVDEDEDCGELWNYKVVRKNC